MNFFKIKLLILVVYVYFHLVSEVLSSNILCLFTSPHRSHMLVYQGVVNGLLKKNHNITIITVLPIDNSKILSKNVTIVQLQKPSKARSANGIFRQIAIIAAGGRLFMDPSLKKFLGNDNKFHLVLLGYLFNDYQLGVAAHFKCPTVVIWTTQSTSFVKRFIAEPIQWMHVPQPFVSSQIEGVRGVAYGVFENVFRWILDILMHQLYREYFPSSTYPSLTFMQNNVSLVLCNHHFSEGPIEAHLPNMIEISGIQILNRGFLQKDILDFIDSADDGVIYFSLGTVVSARELSPRILNIFTQVFSSIPQKVIWKIEDGIRNTSNILTSQWLPQNDILAHPKIKLFITHGGKGSTIEALFHGVPMIAVPFFGDQFANSHRLTEKGFGLRVDKKKINELQLRQNIFEILNNDSYYKSIKKASKLFKDRPLTAEETSTYWIEYVIRHKGAAHMKISTDQLTFIQYYNIDVYLCLLSFIYALNTFPRN